MLSLARSLLRLSTAVSIYGVERAGGLLALTGPRRGRRGTGESLDALAWSTQEQLSENFRLIFQLSDDLQTEWLGPHGPSGESTDIAGLLNRAIAASGTLGASALDPSQWRELANKFEVYRLVRDAHRLAPPINGGRSQLTRAVERAYQSGSHQALWQVEGLAHEATRRALDGGETPAGLLSDGSDLPASSLLMLHAGMGLAFADHVLSPLAPDSSVVRVRGALDSFRELCESNSEPRYVEAALESLGLIGRCFHPGLMTVLAAAVRDLGEPLVDYFWHGVGRAIYFLPIHLIPGFGTIDHCLAMSDREAPDDRSREGSRAGLAWAFTVVNLRHPSVMERFLARQGESAPGATFWEAVIQSVDSRHQTTPGADFIGEFFRHRPADSVVATSWHKLIGGPCEARIGAWYPRATARSRPPAPNILAARERFALASEEGILT